MASLPAKRLARLQTRTSGIIAALDIGCSKTTCLIGRSDPASRRQISILGSGRQQTRGFAGGAITDINALERTVRLAVEDAEREAGEAIGEVILGVTGSQLNAQLVTASIDCGGRSVTRRDVRRIQNEALSGHTARDMQILSAWPVNYTIDKSRGRVRQPENALAHTLGVKMALISAPRGLVRNLVECIGRAHLSVASIVPSAIASGVGSLIDDEIENGAICIDMGAGVTAVSVFLNGVPAWLGLVPAGGAHVTSDIAQGLGTTFAAAERLKTIYGTASLDSPGLSEQIEAPRLGDDGRLHAARLPREILAKIIAPRIEESFELVQKILSQSALRKALPHRVVLTGGASQMPGVRDIASRILGAPVRLGRPTAADALGEQLATPAFSTASGLLLYDGMGFPDAARTGAAARLAGEATRPGRMSTAMIWLKENF